MAEIKHVGVLRANQRKVVVAYRVIPGENPPKNSIIIDTASLGDADHDTLIRTVESNSGQSAFEFAEVMARTTLQDGSNMLSRFHTTGKLQAVPMEQIDMTPNTTTKLNLVELNQIIAEQRGVSVADLAMKDPNELPEGTTIQEAGSVNEMPATTEVAAEAQAANLQAPTDAVLSDEQLAASYRSQADAMFKEAKRLREQAEELAPTKKKKTASVEKTS